MIWLKRKERWTTLTIIIASWEKAIFSTFIYLYSRHMDVGLMLHINKEWKSTGEVSNRSVWMFYSINNVQCWVILYKIIIEKKKKKSFIRTDRNIRAVSKTMECNMSIQHPFLTWLKKTVIHVGDMFWGVGGESIKIRINQWIHLLFSSCAREVTCSQNNLI